VELSKPVKTVPISGVSDLLPSQQNTYFQPLHGNFDSFDAVSSAQSSPQTKAAVAHQDTVNKRHHQPHKSQTDAVADQMGEIELWFWLPAAQFKSYHKQTFLNNDNNVHAKPGKTDKIRQYAVLVPLNESVIQRTAKLSSSSLFLIVFFVFFIFTLVFFRFPEQQRFALRILTWLSCCSNCRQCNG